MQQGSRAMAACSLQLPGWAWACLALRRCRRASCSSVAAASWCVSLSMALPSATLVVALPAVRACSRVGTVLSSPGGKTLGGSANTDRRSVQDKLDRDAALANVPEAAPKLLQLARSTPLLTAAVVGHKGAVHVRTLSDQGRQALIICRIWQCWCLDRTVGGFAGKQVLTAPMCIGVPEPEGGQGAGAVQGCLPGGAHQAGTVARPVSSVLSCSMSRWCLNQTRAASAVHSLSLQAQP